MRIQSTGREFGLTRCYDAHWMDGGPGRARVYLHDVCAGSSTRIPTEETKMRSVRVLRP